MLEFALDKTLQGQSGVLRMQVDARIDDGSFVTLFGPSGAGKTTVLRMLAGLVVPDAGRIVVAGETWFDAQARIALPPQKRSIGFVFQDYALFPNLSVRENIAYAAPRHDAGWVDELLQLTGLTGLQAQRPAMLSGGQKQRVALARAVARKPALLLLDEPLSALDAALRGRLQDDIGLLHRRLGLTTLLVTHDIGEAFRLSQRVLMLDAGRIVQSGSPARIFLHKRMAGKLNLQAQVLDVRREEVVHIVALLVGQDVIEVIASEDEAAGLRAGDRVSLSAKAVSPYLFKDMRTSSSD